MRGGQLSMSPATLCKPACKKDHPKKQCPINRTTHLPEMMHNALVS